MSSSWNKMPKGNNPRGLWTPSGRFQLAKCVSVIGILSMATRHNLVSPLMQISNHTSRELLSQYNLKKAVSHWYGLASCAQSLPRCVVYRLDIKLSLYSYQTSRGVSMIRHLHWADYWESQKTPLWSGWTKNRESVNNWISHHPRVLVISGLIRGSEWK